MAPRGPKTRPTNLKLLTGTARAHRINIDEPQPEVTQPEAPDHLTDAAREEWNRVVVELLALGIVSRLDRGPLAAYCQAYGRWSAAERALARMAARDSVTDGLVVRTRSGNLIQNPLVGAANKAMADMMARFMSELGITPASRSRVSVQGAALQPEQITFQVIYESPDGTRTDRDGNPVASREPETRAIRSGLL